MQLYYRYLKLIPKAYTPFLLLLGFLFISGFSVHQPVPLHAETSTNDISFQDSRQQLSVTEAPVPTLASLSINNRGINLAHILLSGEEETSASDEKRFQELPGYYYVSQAISQEIGDGTNPASLIPHSVKHQITRHLLTVCMLH